MSPSRRASSDSEVESPEPKDSAALSDWLVSDLVPPPEEEPHSAPEVPVVSGEAAPEVNEPAPIAPESSALSSPEDMGEMDTVDDAEADPPSDPDDMPIASDDDGLDAMDEFYPVESVRPPVETATLTPQMLPVDDVVPPESPDSPEAILGAILGSPEQRARRARRVKMAAASAGALIAVLLAYVLFSGNDEPQIDVIELREPPPSVAAAPEGDPIEALETPLPPEEGDVASGAEKRKPRGAAPSASEPVDTEPTGPGGHYGPSVARYPDLPRDILMSLEEQQQNSSSKPATGE